jgi:AcrR family transcriptional regulator
MYHISSDKRSKESAELIYQGLLSCMRQKGFDAITISDLQKTSTVARSTFYRSFDAISDVLYWKCDLSFAEVLDRFHPTQTSGEIGFSRYYFQYWMDHSDILELLVSIHREDIIYDCHMQRAEELRKRYGAVPGTKEEHGDYFMAIRTSFTIGILMVWLKRGRKESLDEIMEILFEQMPLLSSIFSCMITIP